MHFWLSDFSPLYIFLGWTVGGGGEQVEYVQGWDASLLAVNSGTNQRREKVVDGVLSWPSRILMLRGTNCDHVKMNNSNKVNLSLDLYSGLQILFIAAECHMFFEWVTSWNQIAHEYCYCTLPSSHSFNLFWCVMIKLIFD